MTGVFEGDERVSGDLKLRQYCCSADCRMEEGAAGSFTCGGGATGAAIGQRRRQSDGDAETENRNKWS